MKQGRLLAIGVALALFLAASDATAQTTCPKKPNDSGQARILAQTYWKYAQKFFDQKFYTQAMKAWMCSNKMVSHPLSLFNIAKAAELGKHYSIALKHYHAYLEARPNAPERAQINEKIRQMRKKLQPSVRPGVRPGGTLPRRPPPQRRDTVPPSLRHPGKKTGTLGISGWVAVGVGAAVAVVGAALGGLALKAKSEFNDANEGSWWLNDVAKSSDNYDRYSTGAWVCVGIGVAAIVSGAVLIVLDKGLRKKERVSVTPVPIRGGGLVTIGGRF